MFLILLASLLFAGSAAAETLCTPIGSSIYCAGPNQQTTITPLSKCQGVITTPESTQSYSILPKARALNEPALRPLDRLEPLRSLTPEPFGGSLLDRDDDGPLNLSGQSLILGE